MTSVKRAVAIVVIKNASAILSDVNIRETVAIEVANGHSLAVAAAGDASFFGYIAKSSIAIVLVERVTQRRIRIEEIALPLFTR